MADASSQPDPDAPEAPQEKIEVARPLTAFAISLIFHAAILCVLAMVTWVVARQAEPQVILQLGEGSGGPGGGGGGGGGSGQSTEGAAGAGAGNVARKGDEDTAGAGESESIAVPAPALATGGASIAVPLPEGSTESVASAIDPALLAFGGGGMTTGLGGPGSGNGIGAGAGSGAGPGAGSGTGGGTNSGTGPAAGAGFGPGLGGVLDEMRTKGLDVVFVIDATASMLPYTEQSKKRLREIVSVVTQLVAGANVTEGLAGKSGIRFGIVAFKDYGDEYGPEATRSLPLTMDIAQLQKTLNDVAAGGGADVPEPLDKALQAATSSKMGWSRQRKSVIVMVTDAPCHGLTRAQAMQEARRFVKQIGGQINVIDVGGVMNVTATTDDGAATQRSLPRTGVLADLQAIAREGGGSAFLLQDDEAFWRHLIVSIFGQRFEQDIQQIIDAYAKPTRK